MKKGCFIKVIFILTILTAAVLYIFQHKFDELILQPGKKILSGMSEDQVRKEFDFVRQSPEKDTLIILAGKYFSVRFLDNEMTGKEPEEAEKKLQQILSDSVITPAELQELKKYMKEEK